MIGDFMRVLISLILSSFVCCSAQRYQQKQNTSYSICDNCYQPLALLDKIPLFSYLNLKGKCRFCLQPINPLIFICELIGLMIGILFTIVNHTYIQFILVWVYFYIFLVDYLYQMIPDRTILFLFILNIYQTQNLFILIVICLILTLFVYLKKFGFGDVKLIFVTGLSLSLFELNLVFLFSSLFSLLTMLLLVLKKKTTLTSPFPFGSSWVVSLLLVYHLI